MNWLAKFLMGQILLMDGAGEGTGGGGGGGTPPANNPPANNPPPGDDPQKVISDLRSRLEALEKASKGNPPPPAEDPDLLARVRKQQEDGDRRAQETKDLESALRFSMNGRDWAKTNATLLPKTIGSIFETAEKETYDSAVEKANSIKASVISEFFMVQANLDLLTSAQKSALEDFQKLTKTGKQEKAAHIYDMVFEPAFEMLKRIKKAEQLNRGFATPSDAEQAYKERLMKLSRKHFLGEKTDA